MKRRSITGQPDPIFFTDRNLGAISFPTQLQRAGFQIIIHDDHFGNRHQQILDPEVIAECGSRGWFLLTADKDLSLRWAKEIMDAQIGVFCQSNNRDGPRLWAPRFISLREQIIQKANNVSKPFVFQVTADRKSKLVKRDF